MFCSDGEITKKELKKLLKGMHGLINAEDVEQVYNIKGCRNTLYTFAIVVHIANVYIIFLPPFIGIFVFSKEYF